jgi:type I restriction enzyme S subunit
MTLGEVTVNFDRERRPITQSYRVAGPYPYYGANGIQDWVAEYLFEGEYLLIGEDGSVLTDAGRPILNWAEGKFWANNHAHVLKGNEDIISLRFLFHYLQTADISRFVTGGAQPKLNQKSMNKIPIPMPSLSEQDRLVLAMDSFDALVSDLSTGLPAELNARRKQYEHYRDELLTFEPAVA